MSTIFYEGMLLILGRFIWFFANKRSSNGRALHDKRPLVYYYNRVQEHPDCSHFRHNYIEQTFGNMICVSIDFVKSTNKLFIVLYMQSYHKQGSRQNIEKCASTSPVISQNQDPISLANLLNFEVKITGNGMIRRHIPWNVTQITTFQLHWWQTKTFNITKIMTMKNIETNFISQFTMKIYEKSAIQQIFYWLSKNKFPWLYLT